MANCWDLLVDLVNRPLAHYSYIITYLVLRPESTKLQACYLLFKYYDDCDKNHDKL